MTRVWFLVAAVSTGCVHDHVHLGGELPTKDAGTPDDRVDAPASSDRDADGGMREGNQQNSGSQHR